jgi:hypothetical protein
VWPMEHYTKQNFLTTGTNNYEFLATGTFIDP